MIRKRMIRKKDDPGKDDPEFLFYQGLRGIIPFDTFFLFLPDLFVRRFSHLMPAGKRSDTGCCKRPAGG